MSILQHDYSLKKINGFGLNGVASFYAEPANPAEIAHLFENHDLSELPLKVIGDGTNLLFIGDYKGMVLKPAMNGIEVISDCGEEVRIRVGAAENWDRWVEYATGNGWYGLENLSLIPGTVGAAPVQNIGAYGVELREFILWLDAWDLLQKKQIRMYPEQCRFGYRDSIFKSGDPKRYIITHVVFRLSRIPRLALDYGNVSAAFSRAGGKTPADLRNTIISIRNSKLPDPLTLGNAGSFFKNPLVDMTIYKCIRSEYKEVPHYRIPENRVKIPAAWLIEKAGWKGKRNGNVGTWPSQPLVVVNYGGATGREILEFTERIRQDVDNKFGVYLEREVEVI